MHKHIAIVGDEGPEVFTPGQSGRVTPSTLNIPVRFRMRGRVWLWLAAVAAMLGSRGLPLINWLWMRVRFEYALGVNGPWYRLRQPRLFSDG